MATDNVNTVQQLYVAYFGRPADPGGLAYWSAALDADPNALSDITKAFAASVEYQAGYANMNHTQVVSAVYENLFGRAGDVAGITFWTEALDSGRLSVANVVTAFVDGAQGSDAKVFSERVVAADEFNAHLDTPLEVTAYAGSAASSIAHAYLQAIIDDNSAAIAQEPVVIDTAIAQIVGTYTGGPITAPSS